jgi:adenylate cyclase class IV
MINLTDRAFWQGKAIRVRYIGARPITVTGPTTGRRYAFSGIERYQDVDPRDALEILRSASFRAEAIVPKTPHIIAKPCNQRPSSIEH